MKEETLLEKIAIGIMFVAVLFAIMWVPDFALDEEDCANQNSRAYIGKLCSESKAK